MLFRSLVLARNIGFLIAYGFLTAWLIRHVHPLAGLIGVAAIALQLLALRHPDRPGQVTGTARYAAEAGGALLLLFFAQCLLTAPLGWIALPIAVIGLASALIAVMAWNRLHRLA